MDEKVMVESWLEKAIAVPEGDHLTQWTHPPYLEEISQRSEPKGGKEGPSVVVISRGSN
jgi:hypothetical protein